MITITNAELLSFATRFEFPSEGAHNYRNTKELSISVFASDITNESGIQAGISDLIILRETADYKNFTINGRLYERCKVNGFSTEDGDWVNLTRITLDISIYEQGQDNLGIDGNYEDMFAGQWPIFNSLEEQVTISRAENSTSYTRTINAQLNRSANLKLPTNATKGSAEINIARQIIKSILDYDTTNGYSYDVVDIDSEISDILDTPAFKKFRKEAINQIENTISITETLETTNVQENEIGHTYNIDLQMSEEGIISASEKGRIEGLLTDRYSTANSWVSSIIQDARQRLEDSVADFFLDRNIALNDDGGLPLLTQTSKIHNIYEGWIEYTITSTNDPNILGGQSYSLEIQQDNCYIVATEKGKFFALENAAHSIEDRHNQAYISYLSQIATIDARIKTYVSCLMTEPYQRSEGHDYEVGSVEYSRSFTDNPIYDSNLDVDGYRVKKYEVSKNVSLPVFNTQVVPVLGRTNQIVQTLTSKTESSNQYSLSLLLARIPIPQDITKLSSSVDLAKDKINELLTEDSVDPEDRIQAVSHTWSPYNDVTFSIDLTVATNEEC